MTANFHFVYADGDVGALQENLPVTVVQEENLLDFGVYPVQIDRDDLVAQAIVSASIADAVILGMVQGSIGGVKLTRGHLVA